MPVPRPRAEHTPKIAVLLATHNGRRWLPEQLESILGQSDVDVRVIAMDDGSTDGTPAWLAEQAAAEPRVTVLADDGTGGSAAANFYRLIATATFAPDELVAFADQDDLWMPGKLARHASLIEAGNDGVSSNVTAFSADGRRSLIRKSFPQREFDYLLESPGPGSTFLVTQRLITLTRSVLANGPAASVDYHDWLIYALARAHGWSWHIDEESTVDYRQHDENAMGANVGTRSAFSRLSLIRERWHRGQATLLARIGLAVAADSVRPGLESMLALFEAHGLRARLALASRSGQLRRRPRDRRIIGALISTGIW